MENDQQDLLECWNNLTDGIRMNIDVRRDESRIIYAR